jgi:DNA-binding MarR family transcriptional regulator
MAYKGLQPMPVPSDSHDADIDLIQETSTSEIVTILYNNPELTFKPKELADCLGLPLGTITTTLKRLHENEFIEQTSDSHYHALEHREDLHRYVACLEQTKRMFEDLNKDYEEHTDIELPVEDVDEAELEAELAELEAELK